MRAYRVSHKMKNLSQLFHENASQHELKLSIKLSQSTTVVNIVVTVTDTKRFYAQQSTARLMRRACKALPDALTFLNYINAEISTQNPNR